MLHDICPINVLLYLKEYFLTCMETWTILKDFMILGAAVTGAVVAVKGLGTWQQQLKGQSEYELSRRILVTLFKYRDAINNARHPAMWGNEMPSPPDDEAKGMSREKLSHYGASKVYEARWSKVQEQRTALYADLLEAEAIWGPELQTLFGTVFKLAHELSTRISHHLQLINPDTRQRTKDVITKIDEAARDIMYFIPGDEPDEYKQDMLNAIEPIELYLKPKLNHEKV
jgi:hypothetical protein